MLFRSVVICNIFDQNLEIYFSEFIEYLKKNSEFAKKKIVFILIKETNNFLMSMVSSGEFWNVRAFVSPFNYATQMHYGYYSNSNTFFMITYDEYRYSLEQQAEIIGVIQAVEATYEESDTDIEKIEKAYNYLIMNVEYDDDLAAQEDPDPNDNGFTAYGALVNGLSVCQGYAEAMALFLNRLGIDNYIVMSDVHAWNVLYVNGQWLHLDATWDDGCRSPRPQVAPRGQNRRQRIAKWHVPQPRPIRRHHHVQPLPSHEVLPWGPMPDGARHSCAYHPHSWPRSRS